MSKLNSIKQAYYRLYNTKSLIQILSITYYLI